MHNRGSKGSKITFVQTLYQALGGAPGEASGVNYWVNLLNNGESRSDLAADFIYGMITSNLTQPIAGLTAAQYQAAWQRQETCKNRIEASVAAEGN